MRTVTEKSGRNGATLGGIGVLIRANVNDFGFRLEDLTAAVIADDLELLENASPKGTWQPATFNRCRAILIAMLEYATERCGFVSRDPKHPNPARGLRRSSQICLPNPWAIPVLRDWRNISTSGLINRIVR